MSHRFAPSILRDYDIRGTVGQDLGEADAHALGRGFGSHVRRAGGARVAVGRDGRLTSESLEAALIEGLVASGIDVVRIGLGPSPMLYFAEATLDVDGGIQVTGSHNPREDNGFKLVHRHAPFFGEALQRLAGAAAAGDWEAGAGTVEEAAVASAYVDRLTARLASWGDAAPAIGWDAGNGAAGPVVEALVRALPGRHPLLFTAVDGRFPNHHPDPTLPENLADLQALVAQQRLDLGVAFDGDGDRLGVVDARGRVVWGDQILALLAEPLLADHPGAAIVADVKASRVLFERIAALGGRGVMAPSGHSRIKTAMRDEGALLAGEMSGHIFFADDWYGFDDGLYAALRLIEAVIRSGRTLAALVDALPQTVATPELRFACPASRKAAVVGEVAARLAAAGARVTRIDGVRVDTEDGWWLLRASGTQDMLTARAEAGDAGGLDRLLAALDGELAKSGVLRGSQ